MGRPFRLEPPSLQERTLWRPRLLAQLGLRWERRLVTVAAGAGFGKTVLLAAAMTENARNPRGRDVWLSCEPADAFADHLAAGVAAALGLRPDVGLEGVLEHVWAHAPEQICLLLDDLHEMPPDSDGAGLLRRLLEELPGNGHLVFSSRDAPPLPVARLAASGQLLRLREEDLVFDTGELEEFASARGIDTALLASTGGWPALVELRASAGADLVPDYLWEEVLTRVGEERARLLARFAVAGGGDDEMASAFAGRPVRVDDLVAGVPLVHRSGAGWATLHPLWRPALRPLLTDTEATEARLQAAAVHRRAGELTAAVDLLVEAESWDGVLAVMREVAMSTALLPSAELGRWYRLLPPQWRSEPEGILTAGLAQFTRSPLEALALFQSASEAFRTNGDVDGELVAIAYDGVVRSWSNDVAGLVALFQRVQALAAAGSATARNLEALGLATLAHLQGDSDGVLSALTGVDEALPLAWLPNVYWLRSVAHRRAGDVKQAYEPLDASLALPLAPGEHVNQAELARLRASWLEGDVDRVRAGLPRCRMYYEQSGDRWMEREVTLELACKAAWLGELEAARELLTAAEPLLPDLWGRLERIMRAIARAAVAVGDGDEARAAETLRVEVLVDLGGPTGWYWRDRAAIALVHVLVPETRPRWTNERLGPAHRPGILLAQALEGARTGDLSPVRAMDWPAPGVIRAHLPLRWAAELAVVGVAAGNPPPADLFDALGDRLRPALRPLISTGTVPEVVAAATRLVAKLPAVVAYRLRVDVLGALELRRDGEPVSHPDLRRTRVRELLCYLVAFGRVRREEVAGHLWPDLDDGGRNLRVTLNYLQRVLQPDRLGDEPPYFVRAEGPWLSLTGGDRLTADLWDCDSHLDEAEQADRDGDPAEALAAYRAALPLWRGEPFADVPYADWVHPVRTGLRGRYTAAAVRAGELLLAAGELTDARGAARHAIVADRWSEVAYRLLARAYVAEDDLAGARRAVDECRAALSQLDLEPEPATLELCRVSSTGDRQRDKE